jgi:hypothetical protein
VLIYRQITTLIVSHLALVSAPSVSQGRDGAILVEWNSIGVGRGVFGYRVLYKSEGTGWNPYG